MQMFRRIVKPVSYPLLAAFLSLSLYMPAAHAAMVGTETVVSAQQVQDARSQIQSTLDRDDVRQALLARGVSPDQVQSRVDSMTDGEAIAFAQQIDEAPAGGVLGFILILFLILLVTDLMGLTDIFPFVKKPRR